MVFSNLFFLYLFLPVNLLLYYLTKNTAYRNFILILFSLFFYAWGEPVWVFVLIFSVGIDYCNGRMIDENRGRPLAKIALGFSVTLNLSLLGLFKYSGLLVSTLNSLLGLSLPVPSFSLPIGISFYSFQALSYVLDVYRGRVPVQKRYDKLLLYVSLYPQLVAGPIVRYSDIAGEIDDRRASAAAVAQGLTRFLCGLAKKVFFANIAGELLAPYTAADTSSLSVAGAWAGMLLFTLQIYYDFSGYSDMAIGLGRMFGFHYRENFNYPYIARSATEFWRRWHISLSSFFRDYVYIPLGGGRRHTVRNLLIVWFLTGLWHGASWNFVCWGLYYGVLILLERLFLLRLLQRLPAFFSHLYLLFITVIGWTIFYFTDSARLITQLKIMFGLTGAPAFDVGLSIVLMNHIFWLVAAVLLCLPVVPLFQRLLARYCNAAQLAGIRVLEAAMDLLLLALSTCLLVGQSFNPFLYFRF